LLGTIEALLDDAQAEACNFATLVANGKVLAARKGTNALATSAKSATGSGTANQGWCEGIKKV
jgi:hypothetical protein